MNPTKSILTKSTSTVYQNTSYDHGPRQAG